MEDVSNFPKTTDLLIKARGQDVQLIGRSKIRSLLVRRHLSNCLLQCDVQEVGGLQ